MKARRDPAERFWGKVDRSGACWIWTGYVGTHGYGMFNPGGRQAPVPAHRFAYEATIGPIPEGLHIDHLCRNRTCVNPAHLEAVTQAENNRRTRKTHCKRGHEFTDENTGANRNGRYCKACQLLHRRGEAA